MRNLVLFLVNGGRRLKLVLSLWQTWFAIALACLALALFTGLFHLFAGICGVTTSYCAGCAGFMALLYAGVIAIGERGRKRLYEQERKRLFDT